MSGWSYQPVSSRRLPVKIGPNRSSQPASREETAQALGPISQSGARIHMRTTPPDCIETRLDVSPRRRLAFVQHFHLLPARGLLSLSRALRRARAPVAAAAAANGHLTDAVARLCCRRGGAQSRAAAFRHLCEADGIALYDLREDAVHHIRDLGLGSVERAALPPRCKPTNRGTIRRRRPWCSRWFQTANRFYSLEGYVFWKGEVIAYVVAPLRCVFSYLSRHTSSRNDAESEIMQHRTHESIADEWRASQPPMVAPQARACNA